MKSWKRITLVIFVLIGGTTSFGYWSINQFDSIFDNLSASSAVNTLTASSFLKKHADLASTSPEIATSTDETLQATTSTTITASSRTPPEAVATTTGR